MKRFWILILSALALMMPQTIRAEWKTWYTHERDNNPLIRIDSSPEEILNIILEEEGYEDFVLYEGHHLAVQKKDMDAFGNTHLTYNMTDGKEFSSYQLILHFHPDGSLYYRNGTLIIGERGSHDAKGLKASTIISAESASIIATGNPMSETKLTVVEHRGEIHKAYRVTDNRTTSHVYVDAYSGEVLFSIPLLHSYAPWSDVKGSAVKLSANTSYNGLQELIMMQTDKGYILRDPSRNIITLDASRSTNNYTQGNIPKNNPEQFSLITEISDDVLITDEKELLGQEYDAIINGLYITLSPEIEEIPESANVHIYYIDEDGKPLLDIINIDFDKTAWIDEDVLKYKLDSPIAMKLIGADHMMEVTIGDVRYSCKNGINAGDCSTALFYIDGEKAPVQMIMDFDVYATQQSIDVHWGIQNIYDMYNDYFDLKGCDGKGAQIVNVVNPSTTFSIAESLPDNAFAFYAQTEDCHGTPSFIMMYGLGISDNIKPLTSFDVTAHEFTHLVTMGSCNNLLYQNESGALNEALADCMAMVAEYYAFGKPSWLIGKEIYVNKDNMRSFTDPWYSGAINGDINEKDAQPRYYDGINWLNYNVSDKDNGGVHINSGVFNHLFYLLCEGGNNLTNEKYETRDIIPVGIDKMKDIIFHSMKYYNAGLCDYDEIADNLMVVIEDFNDNDSEAIADLQKKFVNAYEHVGMKSTVVPTGINRHQMGTKTSNSRTYNLYGIPVGKDYKGVVIKNGKKMVNN